MVSNKLKILTKNYDKYVMPTYTRTPLCLVKGRGSKVWDIDGREYLDFFPGWAVSGLGHCHPKVISAIKEQSDKILHVSNNYYNEFQGKLAKEISKLSFKGKVFFSNSGAEANEGAVKLARRYGYPHRFEIISMRDSFHGRTLATLTLTGQKKYQKGFKPLPRGFKTIAFNDIKAVQKAVTKRTVGIMLELIQGEGGINVADRVYVRQLRKLCDLKNILLIIDEVQTGVGRTGKMFCYQHYGIKPDIMTLAKSMGGGLPVGALVVDRKIADYLGPGTHASTFGGSPLICAGALAVFEAIAKEKLLSNTVKMGGYLSKKIRGLQSKYPVIRGIRGKGLMLGILLNEEGHAIVSDCLTKGLLINCTQTKVLRIMPPINVTSRQIDRAISILDKCFNKITSR
ncbi:MAG: aspartate aminotransferase family protein [Candidatus Omnitrophica bacterium]|nr:aspartate aminotransferase family protein [Candidatus Omnitrophota bacterium]